MLKLRSNLALLAVTVCALACGSNGAKHSAHDAGTEAGLRADGGHGEPDAALDPFGIDGRPTNATCVAPKKPTVSDIGVERAFPNLSFANPVGLYHAPSDDDHLYVIEQRTGAIKRFPAKPDVTSGEVETVLTVDPNVPQNVEPGDEMGLVGLAFDPKLASNGYAYVYYAPRVGIFGNVIERYKKQSGSNVFDPASKKLIMQIEKPARNHNGGGMAFGSDGFLYIGTGDGGGADDQFCFAQDLESRLGKFLRIDVHPSDDSKPFAIPAGNPFAKGGGLPEIYAWGLRNPWRWSFDRDTGELWTGDVGQREREEVDIIEIGKNYGWNAKEGFSCFNPSCQPADPNRWPGRTLPTIPACDDPSLVDPIVDYGHGEGQAITGGYVYRGSALPALQGTYVYGDFGSGRIWGLRKNGDKYENTLLIDTELAISAFGEDAKGELYVFDWASGAIYHLVAGQGGAADTLPTKLSQTGCVDAHDPKRVLAALIPYDIRVPFWSDGAKKERWFALPEGTKVHVKEDGDFELPPGGVAMKTFSIGEKRVETRFFVRWADGTYGGYTYRWNDDESDATLLPGSLSVELGSQSWYYPSRGECDRCHHVADGGHLGLEAIQLDMALTYPTGKRANQLDTLVHIGVLDAAPSASLEALPRTDDATKPLDARARAYLHANCSHCHRPGASGRSGMDMRYGAANPMLCNAEPVEGDLGIRGAKIVTPGKWNESLLYVRMSRRDDKGMPPLASSLVDEGGKRLLETWIQDLSACP